MFRSGSRAASEPRVREGSGAGSGQCSWKVPEQVPEEGSGKVPQDFSQFGRF